MQLILPFGPIINREFLSNHWLDHRLPLEPEWNELKDAAAHAAEKLIQLWKREKNRVERYGDEAGLEEKFIQPVFEVLGWSLKYQAYLQGREPDYALFKSDDKLNDAIMAGRGNPDFWLHASVSLMRRHGTSASIARSKSAAAVNTRLNRSNGILTVAAATSGS